MNQLDKFDISIRRKDHRVTAAVRQLGLYATASDIHSALDALEGKKVTLLEDLLSAFRQDVTTTRYATWTEVIDYCRRSANPVGRLVLRVAGYDDARLDERSDAICTALQLTNFWQDLERDYLKGRIYVPRELTKPRGAEEADLARRRLTPQQQRT